MDKITRIKQIVESSLNTSFGGEISIDSLTVLPTQKYDEEVSKWVPDSFALFVQIKSPLERETYRPTTVQTTLEGVLGFECCVDFV